MPTTLDAQLGPLVVELLAEFGKNITFIIGGDNQYDPNRGITDQDGQTSVVLKASPPAPVNRGYEEGDAITYIAGTGLGFTPKPGLVLVIDAERWQTVQVKPIYTGELIGAYGLVIRKED